MVWLIKILSRESIHAPVPAAPPPTPRPHSPPCHTPQKSTHPTSGVFKKFGTQSFPKGEGMPLGPPSLIELPPCFSRTQHHLALGQN